jgi:hypothetical protein
MNGISVNAEGVITIDQVRLNKLVADAISGDTTVSCLCEEGNCLRLNLRNKAHGTVKLKLRMIEARHDQQASTVKFQLLERSLEGNPLKALLLAGMPDTALRFLLTLLALPPTIKVENAGDIFSVELRAWLAKSPLAEMEIMGVKVLKCIQVGGVEVEAGRIIVQGRIDVVG